MRTVTLGFPLIHLTSVDSTNKYAAAILHKENATEGTVILADVQTRGKGQGDNIWLSDNGLNLLFSLILKPDFLPAYKQFYLSMCIATGINDCLTDLGIRSQVKWPNDILIKGKKGCRYSDRKHNLIPKSAYLHRWNRFKCEPGIISSRHSQSRFPGRRNRKIVRCGSIA